MAAERYIVVVRPTAHAELDELKTFDRKRIGNAIETQLTANPTTATRNKKPLPDVKPGFEHKPPLWELRVGTHRVFYDVDEEQKTVYVRAVREKPATKRTDEVIQ